MTTDQLGKQTERATREFWDVGESADEVIDPEEGTAFATEEDARSYEDDDLHVYRITVTAERVDAKEEDK
jgi:hypothetical protein